ncbi:MAG: hypothetical protein K2Y35_20290 [Burkholderiales bacterium]|nr:hypothetical protein [Burkholderiales bacterium]
MALSSTPSGALPVKPQAGVIPAPAAVSTIRLKIDGREANDLQAALIDCVIEHRRSTPSTCTATFSNWGPVGGSAGFLYFNRQLLDFGKTFTVTIGLGVLFHGRIVALEGEFPEGAPPRIRVTCEDALAALWERNGFRSFADVSDADVVRRVATDHELTAQITMNGPTRKVIAQAGESDLEFLRARLQAVGAYCWIDAAGRLCAAQEPGGREAAVVLDEGGALRELRVQADVRGQSTRVQARGWNVADKAATSGIADRTAMAGEIPARTSSGAAIRETAFGTVDRFTGEPTVVAAVETQSAAAVAFADRARSFVRGVAQLTEVREALPGRSAELRGVGPLFSGLYRIERVTHRFDTTAGWRSTFTLERPWLGAPA